MTPGRTDAEVVRRHLLALRAALDHLSSRHATTPREAFLVDLDEQWAVERGLLVCAQNVLDVATHLAASHGRDAPDYAAAIDALGELGILPPDFARRLRPLAGFRNILVHGYLKTDPVLVHAVLTGSLADLREFITHVEGFLARG